MRFRRRRALLRCSFAGMQPRPERRTPSRRGVLLLSGLILLPSLVACGLLSPVAPAAPQTASATAAAPAVPSPTGSPTPSQASPSRSFPAGVGTDASGRMTYAVPTEPPCALDPDAPATAGGADGPTLTLNRVTRAWRASEAGKTWGVSTGKAQAGSRVAPRPGSVLLDPGTPYANVDFFEWYGLQTYVYRDPGHAAAKLAAVRAMVRKSCSYPYSAFPNGPSLVVELSEDRPDHLVVSGTLAGSPTTDIFIRYGNTVTEFFAAMKELPTRDALAQVRGALAKA